MDFLLVRADGDLDPADFFDDARFVVGFFFAEAFAAPDFAPARDLGLLAAAVSDDAAAAETRSGCTSFRVDLSAKRKASTSPSA
jgi:hypothetical protein